MKKIFLILLTGVILSGCYTTLYPPQAMNNETNQTIPDSTRQVIINNYYETTEYYQVPHYRRYSLIWGGYYWDPFYYNYDYYTWRPYYWYGSYYYYNPYNHYWYYYDHNYWHNGGGSTGGSTGGNGDKNRIHKPGYTELISSPTGSAPFISVGSEISRSKKPTGSIGVDVTSGLNNNSGYNSRVESVGKVSLTPNDKIYKSSNSKNNESYKSGKTSKTESKSSYNYKSSSTKNSSSSSSGSKSTKPSRTSSTSSKNSSTESSSSSSKKSK